MKSPSGKTQIPQQDLQFLHNARAKKQKLVFTNGCFDLIHRGHITYLNSAKKLGDILIVGLNSDESVRRLKGDKRPIVTEQDRLFHLMNLKMVDLVIVFHEDDPLYLLELIQPNIYTKGGDYQKETLRETTLIQKWGGEVHILDFVEGQSTTQMVEKIMRANL